MIVVLSQFGDNARVLEASRRDLIAIAGAMSETPGAGPAGASQVTNFASAWARLRRGTRHARYFANREAAVHFYCFGNHGLQRAVAAGIVTELRSTRRPALAGAPA
ncbi:MAG: hypothetical protein JSS29_09400 [Proteobacteria bacterium]|nr:hypothetical protein [Pseudomonadota bacterium]